MIPARIKLEGAKGWGESLAQQVLLPVGENICPPQPERWVRGVKPRYTPSFFYQIPPTEM